MKPPLPCQVLPKLQVFHSLAVQLPVLISTATVLSALPRTVDFVLLRLVSLITAVSVKVLNLQTDS